MILSARAYKEPFGSAYDADDQATGQVVGEFRKDAGGSDDDKAVVDGGVFVSALALSGCRRRLRFARRRPDGVAPARPKDAGVFLTGHDLPPERE